MKENKKLCIVGAGGLAREVLLIAIEVLSQQNIDYKTQIVFLVKDEDWNDELIMGIRQLKELDFNPKDYEVVVAVGDLALRKKIVNKLPQTTSYRNLIHPKADVSEFVTLGNGVIIGSGVVLTCNIHIENHVVIDRLATIGHDCTLDSYCHVAPGVILSGNCSIGKNVYLGTGSLIREDISISDSSVIGMGSVVVKNINETGVYVGNPARKINSK